MNAILDALEWRKSSHSGGVNNGDCLEVADGHPGAVPVRDSKQPKGPTLMIPTTSWTAFVKQVQS